MEATPAQRSDIKVTAESPAGIFRNHRASMPFGVFIAFVGFVFVDAMIFALLRDSLPSSVARLSASTFAALIVFSVTAFLISRSSRDLAHCKMEIKDDRLIIRAPSPHGIIERWFEIPTIKEFVLGRSANSVESLGEQAAWLSPAALLALPIIGAVRSGALKVSTPDGVTVFGSIDKLFSQASINAIVNELAGRGVKIRRVAADAD